jgi:hypothetical protein
MQLDHGRYLSVIRRSWAQMKRSGFLGQANPTMTMGIEKERNRMKSSMNLLYPREWKSIEEIQMISDLSQAFCPS